MTDWTRVYAFAKHSYIQSFPVTSFLLAGVTTYKDTVKSIQVGDLLDMTFEPDNHFDSNAIVIKKDSNICGYVPKELKEKVKENVPSKVRVIDKRFVKEDIYSLRVDLIV